MLIEKVIVNEKKNDLPLKMGMMVKGNCVVVGLSNNQLVCMGYSST